MPKTEKQAPIMRENDLMELRTIRDTYGDKGVEGVVFLANRKYMEDSRAIFAMKCVERWAMVAGEPDGVDDAGRQKLRRLSPDELVVHAMDTSEKLFAAMIDAGWMIETPSTDEAKEVLRQAEDAAEATNDG